MNNYSVCLVSKEFRWVEVEAKDETEAKDKVWDKIESVENCKAQYFDHEIFIDEE